MTEEEARAWTADVPHETVQRLERFAGLVVAENARQNLISAATVPNLWGRHIVDSLQLARLAPEGGRWLDLGSGAGFPGIVIAIGGRYITLVESRTMRAAFLAQAVAELGLAAHVAIYGGRLERMPTEHFAVITARAFAPLDRLFGMAHRFSTAQTRWLLPKGRGAAAELAAARASWQGSFDIVPSVTDPESGIIVASDVRPGRQRR